MFSNRKEVENCIYEACESISREYTSDNEVKNTMNKLLLGRKINNEEVCGNYENKEKDNEKGNPKYDCKITNKVKYELKLNVDEQQDAIKHLKEYCDIDDIEPP